MANEVPKARETCCSFCGRSSRETGPHVEGPGDVYMCERCVGISADIFADLRGKGLTPSDASGAPRSPTDQPDWARCSFCGAQRSATGPMLAGPSGLYLCLACVDQAAWAAKEIRAHEGKGETEGV